MQPPECCFNCLQRGFGLRTVRSSGLRHVGTATTALAAKRFGAFFDKIDGIETLGEVVGDTDHDAGFAVLG